MENNQTVYFCVELSKQKEIKCPMCRDNSNYNDDSENTNDANEDTNDESEDTNDENEDTNDKNEDRIMLIMTNMWLMVIILLTLF